MLETIYWQNYHWATSEHWGLMHPDAPYKWYDPDCVILEGETLKLLTKHSPKKFTMDGKTYYPQTGIGIVVCNQPFFYGEYEIIAKLPEGHYLWPAIWLWGLESWPPEIDIIEGYTRKKNYLRFDWPPYAVKSNLHYRVNENQTKQYGAKNVWLGLMPPQKRFIKYGMTWKPDSITIKVNDNPVRVISGEVMKHFQVPMRFVINNGVQSKHNTHSKPSVFTLTHFKYIPTN
jgi:beta-glucanase (GH16 family)